MGMYDNIEVKKNVECPKCNHIFDDVFQTKKCNNCSNKIPEEDKLKEVLDSIVKL